MNALSIPLLVMGSAGMFVAALMILWDRSGTLLGRWILGSSGVVLIGLCLAFA